MLSPTSPTLSRQESSLRGALPDRIRWYTKLYRTWRRLQVSYHGGKYSIQRTFALEAYTKKTSLLRALLVCLVTPIPVVLLIIIQEAVPLQDPSDGWQENYGFWIRALILAFVVAHLNTNQVVYFIIDVVISERRGLLISACASVSFIACAVLVVSHLVFPVPFFVLSMAPIFYTVLAISFRLVAGSQIIHNMLLQRDQLIWFIFFDCVEVSAAVIYPAFETLFRLAQGSEYQLPVALLLPVIKVAIKNLVMRCTKHVEDMMPETVIFTVDFFNAIYVATCMQSGTSAIAVAAIAVCDISQTVLMLYGLHRRTAAILPKLHQQLGPILHGDSNVLTMLGLLCRDLDKFKTQLRARIRIHSCLSHQLPAADMKLLNTLNKITSERILAQGKSIPTKDRIGFCSRKRAASISPVLPSIVSPKPAKEQYSHSIDLQRSTVLRESLEVLFTIECLVTSAYLEAAVPFFYACYVLMMVNLPNARYHTEMTGITVANVASRVSPLLLFGLLQIASFMLLMLVIKRNCGMKALFQLAFVLETQSSLIQNKLLAWMVVTLCFRVVHFGNDFTFQFKFIDK